MFAFLPDLMLNLLGFLAVLVALATFYVRYSYGYWKRRKVPYLEPTFPFGNGDRLIPKGLSVGFVVKKFYDEFRSKGQKAGGVYIGTNPMLVVVSPDWIKEVLIKDFQNFSDRGIYMNEKDPLSVHLGTQSFAQWKPARLKFTPLFTSARIKAMFGIMLECSEGLKIALENLEAQRNDVNVLEVAACYAIDVIGLCAFGIDCKSFQNPDAEFRTAGRKYFKEFSFMDRLNILLTVYTPNLAKKLGARSVQKDVSEFFLRTIRDTVDYREKNNVRNNDLLQLLIDMTKSEAKMTVDELVGQIFIFFLAGYETSSATTTMTLFEISRNEPVQKRIREEVWGVLKRYDGKITYDALAEMKYLEQAVEESLRLWPPVMNINRLCTEDHKFSNSDIVVEKGTPVLIPSLGLQYDPEYWPDPEKWDPDRFSEENRKSMTPFTYLPFGEGPRNCLGLRFGLVQLKTALVTVLRDYRVSLSPNTVLPLEVDPEFFALHTTNDIYLRLEKIRNDD